MKLNIPRKVERVLGEVQWEDGCHLLKEVDMGDAEVTTDEE